MTDDEIISVVQAHKEGKEIQVNSNGTWRSVMGHPVWNFPEHEYRVAPEPRKPREWWLNDQNLLFADEHTARSLSTNTYYDPIHVREVI